MLMISRDVASVVIGVFVWVAAVVTGLMKHREVSRVFLVGDNVVYGDFRLQFMSTCVQTREFN